MKTTIILTFLLLSISSSFAGEMKKIDTVSRETVANSYYTGMTQDGYYDFMYQEIWNMKLEEKTIEGCLVVVSGFTTEVIIDVRSEIKFNVCVNKVENDYTGFLLQ